MRLNIALILALILVATVCFATNAVAENAPTVQTPTVQTPKLFVSLPDYCPTPDGMEIDSEGNLVVACPNYADKTKPACIIKIDKEGNVRKWFNVPTIPETGWASPMGLAFGPDGELFICDNQGWMGTPEGQFKGRLIGCKVEGMGDNAKVTMRVIADGIEHPNGVRYHNGKLYVTNSLMTKVEDESGLLVSGVYCFDAAPKTTVEMVGYGYRGQATRTNLRRPAPATVPTPTITVTNTKQDPNLLLTVLTYNKECQYGLDGIAFGPDGALYLGNFGDGSVLRAVLNDKGKVVSCETWAKDLKHLRTVDGICFDKNGNLYIADFSENAIAVVKPDSRVYRIAQSPDSDGANGELDQPGEPIVWNGKLFITCFDCVTGPDKVNTKHQPPYTITTLELIQ